MALTRETLRLVETICTADQVHSLLSLHRNRERVRLTAENKETLVHRNLRDAVDAGAIQERAVFDLIRDAEENGAQHIFYFRCNKQYGSTLKLESVAEHLWGKHWATKMAFPQHKLIENDYVYADARAWNPEKEAAGLGHQNLWPRGSVPISR